MLMAKECCIHNVIIYTEFIRDIADNITQHLETRHVKNKFYTESPLNT